MKQVIILETNPSEGGLISIRTAFWLPVPSGQEVPIPALAQAAWKNATDEELAALQKGEIIEEVRTFVFPVSLGVGDVQKILMIAYSDRAEYLASVPNKGQYYGAFLQDGTWTEKR